MHLLAKKELIYEKWVAFLTVFLLTLALSACAELTFEEMCGIAYPAN